MSHSDSPRRVQLIAWLLRGLPSLFLAFDATLKLTRSTMAVDATAQLGYSSAVVLPLGLIQLGCLALYLVPKTSVLGALLWTGYLGGAVATHVRLENPLFSHVLFPVYIAAMLWGGLIVSDPLLRRAVFRRHASTGPSNEPYRSSAVSEPTHHENHAEALTVAHQ